VHVKDRAAFGTSRPFGQGSSNFDGFFSLLMRAGYAGDFLTQHYFDADPEAAAAHSLAFVRGQLQKRKAA
jgi:sugar phosphate isomerase/epimerase